MADLVCWRLRAGPWLRRPGLATWSGWLRSPRTSERRDAPRSRRCCRNPPSWRSTSAFRVVGIPCGALRADQTVAALRLEWLAVHRRAAGRSGAAGRCGRVSLASIWPVIAPGTHRPHRTQSPVLAAGFWVCHPEPLLRNNFGVSDPASCRAEFMTAGWMLVKLVDWRGHTGAV